MKFQVDQDAFADAVAWAARTLPTRPSIPVLGGILLTADDDGLVISSFDYEVSASATTAATIARGGRGLVSGRLLAEITRSLPSQPVDVELDGTRVVLRCGSTRFTLPTLPIEEYPTLPALPPRAGTVAADSFATAANQVAIAAGRDDTLPILTGVRIELDGEIVTLAATDRYRLAVRELRWQPARPDITAAALVPARTLSEVARSLTGGAQVEIFLSFDQPGGETLIGFAGRGTSGERQTTTRLIDGEYVKYRSLFPSETAARAHVATTPFIEAVKRVSLVAPRNVPVRLTFHRDQLLLEAGSGEEAQASEWLDATFDGEEEFTIAFNPSYLLDGLGAVDSEIVHLDFTSPNKPAILRGGKDADQPMDDYRYLLMPVRLGG